MSVIEAELKNLMIADLNGDAAAHRSLLESSLDTCEATTNAGLRSGRSATEAEDSRARGVARDPRPQAEI